MFKKILSVLLCAVLILSTIIGTVTANDDAVLNLDFENYPSGGALNKFKIADTGDTAYGKALYGNFTAADANASPSAAIFTSSAKGKLQKGTEYEISLSYKAIELNSTFALHLLYADNANSYVRKKIPGSTSNTPAATSPYLVRFAHNGNGETPRNEWLTATVSFTPEYDAYVYLSLWTNAAAEFYIDNVVISKKGATPPPELVDPNLVVDWDFENYPSGGALNKFKIADTGDTAQGKALYGNFTAADANASPAAALMTSTSDAKVETGATYEVSLKYKAVNLNSTFALHLFYADNANSYVRKKIPGTTSNTPAAVSPYLVRFAHNGAEATVKNQWITLTASFTAEYDAYLYLGLWTNAITEFYIDDFKIIKVKAVEIKFNTNGGTEIEPLSGSAGSNLSSFPTPQKEGFSFAGWYNDEALTTPFTSTVFPENDITLYAKWKREGECEQDFEGYTASSGRLANYVLFTSNGTDGNAHSGIKSIYRSGDNKTFRVALFPDETKAPLVAGNNYELRFWVKIASTITATSTIQLMYSPDKNNCNAQVSGSSTPNICVIKKVGETSTNIDASKVGEWQEVVYNFSATHNGYLNFTGWGQGEYYLDDVSLKCLNVANATISFNTNGGTEIEPIKGVAGTTLSNLPVPTKPEKIFDGWYADEQLTTPFTSTVFPENDTTLYAKWVDEGVYEQTFEGYTVSGSLATNTLSVYTKQSETDPFVHSGSKSLYKPAVKNSYFLSAFPYSTQKLKAGKGYKLTMWVYAPQKVEKENEGAWQLTLLDSKDNAFSVGDRKKLNIKYFNSTFKEGEWQQLELIFTPSADGFMGLYAYGAFEMYVDDITLVEVNTVTVSFETLDGNPMESLSGAAGQIVSTVPTPTHPEEKAFAGWFTDAEYTKKYNFKTLPQNDLTVYAKWITKGSFEQTFEDYYYENDTANGTYTKATLSVYHATSDNDTNVHSGKSSMRYYQKLLPEAKTYGFSIFDPTMGQLEIGEKYYVSYWMKPVEISNTFYHAVYSNSVVDNAFANYNMHGYFTTHADVIGKTGDVSEYFFGPAGKYFVSEPDENGWIKFTFEATATDKYFSIYLNYDAEVYIDDVVIEPLPTGVVNNDYNKPVCEPLYDEIHSTYPAASTTRSNEVQIYKLELNPRGDYVFSADIRPNTMGVYAALSFDGVNIIEGTKITFNSAKRVMLDKSGVVYLHVYNPIGESIFGRLQLFNTRAGKEKISNYVDVPQNTEIPELSELLKQKEYSEILADAIFDDDSASFEDDFDYNSPQTGDSTSLALVSIILCLATAFIVLTKKKGGHKYE